MTLPIHLALTADGVDVPTATLNKVAAALNKQVLRDFGPIWSVSATVDPFVKLDDVPVDYWPIIVQKDVQGAQGYHEDENGQPFGLVEFDQEWPLTASHECLEMLADPFGRRLRAGEMPEQAIAAGLKPARVEFLVEVCDPSEHAKYGYRVNGVTVSDFYTPNFFDPVKAPGVRYSFTGAIDAPRKVLDDGYLSWREPVSGQWFQLRMFADSQSKKLPHVVNLSNDTVFNSLLKTTSLRSAIDRVTPKPLPAEEMAAAPMMMAQASQAIDRADEAQAARASALRRQIDQLKANER